MDQSSSDHPVHPVTNGLLPAEGKTDNSKQPKDWVKFESNDQTNQSSSSSETEHAIKHKDDHPVHSSSLSEAAEQAVDILETVVAVITPSASIQVSRDPLTDSSPASSPVFHAESSSPVPSLPGTDIAAAAGDSRRGLTSIGSRKQPQQQNQSKHLMNEISCDTSTVIPIPESCNNNNTSAATTTTTMTTITGAANHPMRPNTLPSTNKSFKNGQIIVTLLPLNTSCAWITPARFRPELVPEELMHSSLTLTVEEYVQGMSILVNDHRFTLFNILYKRMIFLWISMGFIFLISMLFSGARGVSLFLGGTTWLILNALGIFACLWFKFKLVHALESCVSSVNAIFVKHNLLLGIDDRGHLSCHKINLFFVYFDTSHCVKYLNEMIGNGTLGNRDTTSAPGTANGAVAQRPVNDITNIEIDDDVVIITSASNARNSRKVDRSQGRAERLILRYSQRWVKEYTRKRLDLRHRLHYTSPATAADPNWTELPPRHCIGHRCLCQFIEEHLKFKPLTRFTIRDICC